MDEKDKKAAEYEIELRGYTLKVSIKFEVALMDIVYFSNSEQYIDAANSPSLKIKNLTFAGKIKRASDMLTKHHPDLLIKYETLFNDLSEFKIIRNQIAHCAIYWVDDTLKRFQIWDVEEDNTKLQFYSPIDYTRAGMVKMLVEFLEKIIYPLLSLVKEVQARLKVYDPHLYSALTEALGNNGQAK